MKPEPRKISRSFRLSNHGEPMIVDQRAVAPYVCALLEAERDGLLLDSQTPRVDETGIWQDVTWFVPDDYENIGDD